MALHILLQFVFRLSFGMALSMAITPSKLVTSGFFRVHLWVLLGLATLAILAAVSAPTGHESPSGGFAWTWAMAAAIAAAAASYVGAVLWLYELARPGKVVLALLTVIALAGGVFATPGQFFETAGVALAVADVVSGGLLLGVTMAAMLLGHWYLNTPTMKLLPLKRLVLLMGAAVVVRGGVCAIGLWLEVSQHAIGTTTWWFIALRWLSGIVGVFVLAVMTWETLKVPNTQSATGILYVGVICTFLGELTSELLSAQAFLPL